MIIEAIFCDKVIIFLSISTCCFVAADFPLSGTIAGNSVRKPSLATFFEGFAFIEK